MKGLRRILLLPALALPLTAGTCTEEKIVDLVIGLPTTATFLADGELNVHFDEALVDVKEDLDIAGALEDADLEASDIETIQIVQIFYRVSRPEAGRSIENGELQFTRVGAPGGSHLLVSGVDADMSAVTDWIDVTDKLQPGINEINAFLDECVAELQGGPPVVNTQFLYEVSGDSVPGEVPTDFEWQVKIVIQAVAKGEFEIPFG